MDARTLHERLEGADAPLVLDVRNEEEFAKWRVGAARGVDIFNVPYFAFIEDETAAVERVRRWAADRVGGRDLVVVCAKGGSSEYVAEVLKGKDVRAENLDGGMIAWGRGTVCRDVPARGMRAWQVQRFGKGCLSYILAAGEDAIVVDPHRDLDDYLRLLDERRVTLRAVVDTHLHADHVSGAHALAVTTGATHHVNASDFEGARFPFEALADGRPIRLGRVEVTPLVFLHTPGHTPGSSSLLAGDELLLTGDTLFIESVGRPDLAGKASEWSHDLWNTLNRRFASVPDGAVVLPAHTAGPHETRAGGLVAERLGALRRSNPALALDEAAFVAEAMGAARPGPPEYARIRELNLAHVAATEDELTEVELGQNECAMARKGS